MCGMYLYEFFFLFPTFQMEKKYFSCMMIEVQFEKSFKLFFFSDLICLVAFES